METQASPETSRSTTEDSGQELRSPLGFTGQTEVNPAWERVHKNSMEFLVRHNLIQSKEEFDFMNHEQVAWGIGTAYPYCNEETFQLITDWTNHNCLHDDAVEKIKDPQSVIALAHSCMLALAGEALPHNASMFARALAEWRQRAVHIGTPPWLEHFAQRCDAMSHSFVTERYLTNSNAKLPLNQYIVLRTDSSPLEAWFDFADLALGLMAANLPRHTQLLRHDAVEIALVGNEVRTSKREQSQGAPRLLRQSDAGTANLIRAYNAALDRFEQRAALLVGDSALYAHTLARALHALSCFERRANRGLAGPSEAQQAPAPSRTPWGQVRGAALRASNELFSRHSARCAFGA